MNVIRNERMGTAYGDQIIRGVAECIRASLRTGEQVYRILGDEYLLVNEIGGTVEDGIETEDELAKIAKMKPDYIQGYYYSKPCTSDEFKEKYHIM